MRYPGGVSEHATAIVVMGVSGVGKTTVARALAARLGGVFVEADDLHAPEARKRMAAGEPLTDEERMPWLRRVGDRVTEVVAGGGLPVVACSALRRRYREALVETAGGIAFVQLSADADRVADRLAERTGHFMPPSLLDTQLATLEPLESDERGAVVSAAGSVDEVVAAAEAAALQILGGRGPDPAPYDE